MYQIYFIESPEFDTFYLNLKETCSPFKKWPLNLWWISDKTIMEVGSITKAANFKGFLHLSYKNTKLLFFVTVFFKIFMRKTTDHFWGLHKNMNCGFLLKILLKGMLRQNIEHFLKKPTQEKLGISKMK